MAHNDGTVPMSLTQAGLINEPDFLQQLVTDALQTILEAEITAHLAAQPYERTTDRRGYRNGYKPRQLHTRVGTLDLLVPQDREGTFSTDLFARYQRSEQALVLTLMEMYLQGVSTRKVAKVTEQLCGTQFSKSQVSVLTGQLDEQLTAWRNRPLTAASYPYLTVDARYEKVRHGGRVVSQGVLMVSAVRDDGYRELIAVDVADTESEASYDRLFRQLKDRGLCGVQLVTSDDHRGLRSAIERHFQGSSWQRCQVHFSRNLQARVAQHRRREVAEDLRTIFVCAKVAQAQTMAGTVADRCGYPLAGVTHPLLAEQLDEELEDCLACLAFPQQHQKRIRTTNGLERVSQELKRRTRVIRIFPNRASCLRLVTAKAAEISDEWESGRKYLTMTDYDELEVSAKKERQTLPAAAD